MALGEMITYDNRTCMRYYDENYYKDYDFHTCELIHEKHGEFLETWYTHNDDGTTTVKVQCNNGEEIIKKLDANSNEAYYKSKYLEIHRVFDSNNVCSDEKVIKL